MTVADIPQGMRLSASAGWNQVEPDWRIFFESPGSGGFLAENDGVVVGTVAFLRYDRLAWIAMMLVGPEHRGSGIGGQLMKRALHELRDVVCVGLDATPLGEPLYLRYGMKPDCTLVRMKGMVHVSQFYGARAQRMSEEDFAAVMEQDREVFGADRSALLRSLRTRAPECSWIVRERTGVAGYCFGRPGRLFQQWGPVVAADFQTARELACACLAQFDGRPVAVDVPLIHNAWREWLEAAGFAAERPFVRMFRPPQTHPGLPARQYATSGPEFA